MDISSSLVVDMSVSPATDSPRSAYTAAAHRIASSRRWRRRSKARPASKLAMTFEIVSRIQEAGSSRANRPNVIMLPGRVDRRDREDRSAPAAGAYSARPCSKSASSSLTARISPDLSDEASVRSALRRAKAIALADPQTAAGRYLNGMLQRLGLLEELRGRLIQEGAIHGGGEEVASGAGGDWPLSGQRGRAHRRCERCRAAAARVAELPGLWRGHSGLQSIARCGACIHFLPERTGERNVLEG